MSQEEEKNGRLLSKCRTGVCNAFKPERCGGFRYRAG